eukprot:COSAG06_NODE_297_length_18026_cov_50.901545_10_plen_60_part_00
MGSAFWLQLQNRIGLDESAHKDSTCCAEKLKSEPPSSRPNTPQPTRQSQLMFQVCARAV